MRLNYAKIFKIFILLFVCSLFIPLDTFALSQTWAPYDIVIQIRQGNQNVNTVVNPPSYYSDTTLGHYYSWGDQYNSFTLPASIYFRYNNASNNLCGSNYGNVSGQFYALQSFNTYTYEVQAENRNTKQRYGCSTTPNGHYMSFVCSGLDLTQNYNFVLNNLPRVQRYGLGERFEVHCINDTSSIITNNNYNTDRIIENNNNNTNRLLDSQTETNDLLKSEEAPNSNGFFDEVNSLLDESPITNLVTIPLTLINAYISGFNATCSPVTLGTLYGHTLTLPCIDIPHFIGSTLWATIDGITCIIIIYNIILMCIGIFESITSLDDTMQYLYTPRHGDLSREGRGHSRGDY